MKFFLLALLVAPDLFATPKYMQNCRAVADDYLQFSVEINAAQLAFKITAFEDADCKTPYLNYNHYFTITSVQNEEINLHTDKITYTSLSEEVSSALRLIRYCGQSDWQTASETDVTGRSCDGFQQLAHGDFFYQILKRDSFILKFGTIDENRDGRSVQSRPVQFDEPDYLAIK